MADNSISALAHELLQREMAANPDQFLPNKRWEWEAPPAPDRLEMKALSPQLLALLGGGADIAATYTGLKRGVAKEDNPSLQNMTPARTALGLGLGLAQSRGLSALLRKLMPKASPVADAIDANQGALQASLAGKWGELLAGNKAPEGGYAAYMDRFGRARNEASRRK